MLNKSDPPADKKEPVVIKKYANRRLYNTETSTYVTLDDLAAMVKSERDFVVFDAKTGDDLTHSVLTQIIVEQESRMGSADAAADPLPAPADPLLRRQHRAPGAELPADQPGDAGQGAGALPQAVRRRLHAGRRLRGLPGAGAQEPRHVRAGDGDVLALRPRQELRRQAGRGGQEGRSRARPSAEAAGQADEIAELKAQLATMQSKLEKLSDDRQ